MTQVRNVIGQSVPRRGLAEKLTGECRYTADLKLPGMLHAKVLASPHPHADVVSINTSAGPGAPGRPRHFDLPLTPNLPDPSPRM